MRKLKLINIPEKYNYFPKFSGWIFIVLLLLLSLIYDYHEILFKPPQSIHMWRQCDCLSITLNYAQDNNRFFQPAIHNLGADGTGRTASDFPLVYYSVAQLWKLAGQHEFIYRLIVLLFFFAGLYALFKSFEDIIKDSFLAIISALFLFTSPTIVYYANNFLMDIPALSLAMAGLHFFIRFSKTGKNRYFYFFIGCFTLAGLLKISSLLVFFAISGLFVLELFRVRFYPGKKIFNNPFRHLLLIALVLAVQILWYSYAAWYNSRFNSGIFLIGILPAWKLSRPETISILDAIYQHIRWDYFRRETFLVIILLFVFILFYIRKIHKALSGLIVLTAIGAVVYIALFFQALKDHDYYTINLFIIVPLIFMGFMVVLKERFNPVYNSLLFRIILVAFLVHNIDFARRRIEDRYDPVKWQNKNYVTSISAFTEIRPYLRSIGIKEDDRVISISDPGINVSLYLMNRKGWTSYGINFDGSKIREKIEMGAKYLFVYDKKNLEEEGIKPFINNKTGEFRNIQIYNLTDDQRPKTKDQRPKTKD